MQPPITREEKRTLIVQHLVGPEGRKKLGQSMVRPTLDALKHAKCIPHVILRPDTEGVPFCEPLIIETRTEVRRDTPDLVGAIERVLEGSRMVLKDRCNEAILDELAEGTPLTVEHHEPLLVAQALRTADDPESLRSGGPRLLLMEAHTFAAVAKAKARVEDDSKYDIHIAHQIPKGDILSVPVQGLGRYAENLDVTIEAGDCFAFVFEYKLYHEMDLSLVQRGRIKEN